MVREESITPFARARPSALGHSDVSVFGTRNILAEKISSETAAIFVPGCSPKTERGDVLTARIENTAVSAPYLVVVGV
jgi:hypothetical protein